MKIFDVLFLAIRKREFDFLVRRHNTDVRLYGAFGSEWDIRHIKHYEPDYTPEPQGSDQIFFPGSNSFFHLPLRLAKYVQREQPDILITPSFRFSFQQFILNFFLPRNTKLIVQHHTESPYKNRLKLRLQQKAFARANAFIFTSSVIAAEFVKAGIIRDASLVYEMPEGSTPLHATDKAAARQSLKLPETKLLFLWVGRLIANKDPLTMLKAFGRFAKNNPRAQLFMFYHEEDLLAEVKHFIEESGLTDNIHLQGRATQEELESWYNACDFFISASHYESTGFAFLEALACGCVPIASNIPSFQKLSNNGDCAILFEPGNADDLYEKLRRLDALDYDALRQRAITHFEKELSFPALSRKFMEIISGIHE